MDDIQELKKQIESLRLENEELRKKNEEFIMNHIETCSESQQEYLIGGRNGESITVYDMAFYALLASSYNIQIDPTTTDEKVTSQIVWSMFEGIADEIGNFAANRIGIEIMSLIYEESRPGVRPLIETKIDENNDGGKIEEKIEAFRNVHNKLLEINLYNDVLKQYYSGNILFNIISRRDKIKIFRFMKAIINMFRMNGDERNGGRDRRLFFFQTNPGSEPTNFFSENMRNMFKLCCGIIMNMSDKMESVCVAIINDSSYLSDENNLLRDIIVKMTESTKQRNEIDARLITEQLSHITL